MRIIYLVIFLFFTQLVCAQSLKKVTASYTYYAPLDVTVEVAKQKALECAQAEAIASEFGVAVSQSNFLTIEENNYDISEDFKSIGSSDILGEWIETIGEPIYKITFDERHIIIEVTSEGYIREIVTARANLETLLLRNGTQDRFRTDTFHNGDDLYLKFKSPQDGYLLIYFLDANHDIYCLLPYLSDNGASYKIESNRDYVFFSQLFSDNYGNKEIVDEYTMTAEKPVEYNAIYVVFSPSEIIKPCDDMNDTTTIRVQNFYQFQEWLSSNRKRDNSLQVKKLDFIVRQ